MNNITDTNYSSGSHMLDMMIIGSFMSLLTSQVSIVFTKLFGAVGMLFRLLLVFCEKSIFWLLVGNKLGTVIITDYNPVYSMLEERAFHKSNKTTWWFWCYKLINKINTYKPSEVTQKNSDLYSRDDIIYQGSYQHIKAITREQCKDEFCPLCLDEPIMLDYPSNVYDAKLVECQYHREHYE